MDIHPGTIKLQSSGRGTEISALSGSKRKNAHRFRGQPQVPFKHRTTRPPYNSSPVRFRDRTNEVDPSVQAVG